MINKSIVLIGITGCGKSTIGKLLSKRLQLPFYDVDEYIEKQQMKSIKDIFIKGEDSFREIESLALKEIVNSDGYKVISTGGGVVKIDKNMEFLTEDFIVIFLNRDIDEVIKNIDVSNRPLLSEDLSKLYELYEQRLPLYRRYCDIEITSNDGIQETVDKLLRKLR